METKKWDVDKLEELSPDHPHIVEASKLLKRNEIVAFPTETVYGLGANALSDDAVNKIFEAKGRPSDNPLIVHIANSEQLNELVEELPFVAHQLVEHFWPGPLTLVLTKKASRLSNKVTPGLKTVALRMPDHPVALALLRASKLPLAAPSANLSGRPSPTTAMHVVADLDGRIAGVINGGATGVGLESTVIDCTANVPVILRPGGVTKEQIEAVVGEVYYDQALNEAGYVPKSPGMKYTHYAPSAPLQIVDGSRHFLQTIITNAQREGKKVGVLTTSENSDFYDADVVAVCGSRKKLATVANQLYKVLRSFDERHVDIIYSESFPSEGVGQAIMNRLLKAAGYVVIK